MCVRAFMFACVYVNVRTHVRTFVFMYECVYVAVVYFCMYSTYI